MMKVHGRVQWWSCCASMRKEQNIICKMYVQPMTVTTVSPPHNDSVVAQPRMARSGKAAL